MSDNTVHLDNIWDKIGAISRDEVRLAVLQDEIEIHKSRLEPHDTGHLHTTIFVIKNRIDELEIQLWRLQRAIAQEQTV
tara:strand:- start:635 stop:871 length:237 start_codon:yes stop_codon:yes gene_type:complete